MTDTATTVLGAVFGALIGSFLNVCISRWPRQLSVVHPRSRCPGCERPIAWYENIPVVSWLALRARCRGCGQPISIQYPAVELAVALLWGACVHAFGPTFEAIRVAIFVTLLLGVAVTDAQHYVIPDGFTVSGFVWNLVAAGIALIIGGATHFADPVDALFGACAGAGAIAIAGWLGEVAFKKEAMGFGDVTLMAMVGAAVGKERALLTVFLGACFGAVGFLAVVYPISYLRSKRRGEEFQPPLVPFGVFLAPGAVVALLWGERLMQWYDTFIST